MKRLAALLLGLLCHWGSAQDASFMQQGTDFAKSLSPTGNAQLVNPAGVNARAWGSNTGIASSVPPNMGSFSRPSTDSSNLNQAKALGLGGLGQSALDRCASYQPTGDPAQDQECAAVNFLTQKCLTPSSSQQGVLGNIGSTQMVSDNCIGTYGQGQQHFDFANRVDKLDPAFAITKGAQANPSPAAQQSCVPQTVVTEPAKFAVNKCSSFSSSNEIQCSQTLSASMVTSHGPPTSLAYDCPIPVGSAYIGWTGPTTFADMTMANYLRYPSVTGPALKKFRTSPRNGCGPASTTARIWSSAVSPQSSI
jgi:hypothetical protein